MQKIKKVTIEYTDKIYIAEGKDAEDWLVHVDAAEGLFMSHFGDPKVKWTRIEESPAGRENWR